MQTNHYLMDKAAVRGHYPYPAWLANAVLESTPELAKVTRVIAPENPDLDICEIFYNDLRVAVIHFLHGYDSDGGRLLFAVVDLTPDNEFLAAIQTFNQQSGSLLRELRCA